MSTTIKKFINNKITHQGEIQNRMSNTQITNALIEDTNIKTSIQLVANTYMNISFEKLTKKLSVLNAQLNQKYFRYYQKYPDKRMGFHCYHERVFNNTHSNIFLRIPPEYDVLNVILDMEKLWKKLDTRKETKFQLYQDYNVKDQFRCTAYGRKEKYYVPI